jgi:hypothetical protein
LEVQNQKWFIDREWSFKTRWENEANVQNQDIVLTRLR